MERNKKLGRPRKYKTPEEAKEAKRVQDRARPHGGHKERVTKVYPQCCIDSQAAGVESYGPNGAYVRKAKIRICQQHQ